VQLVKVAKTDLTDNAQKLIGRLLTELKLYLMQISKQQLLAIATNPLTATLGIDQLMDMTLLLADNKVTNNIDYRKKAQETLVVEIYESCSELLKKKHPNNAAENNNNNETSAPGHLTKKNRLRQLREQKEQERLGTEATSSGTDLIDITVREEVNTFFKNGISNWVSYLTDKIPNTDWDTLIGGSRWEWAENVLLIGKHFDIMDWWEHQGKAQYPYTYIVACTIMPLPDSNRKQERNFSGCTWMDAKLMENQHEATFEMRTTIYANNDWMESIRFEISEEYKTMARDRTRKLMEDAVKRHKAAQSKSTGSATDTPSPSNNNNNGDNNIAPHDDEKNDNELLQELISQTASERAPQSTSTSTSPPNTVSQAAV
jgi:hypothetical protein